MGNLETVFVEVEVIAELEKGEVLQIWEKDVKLRRWKDTGSRTYYYKIIFGLLLLIWLVQHALSIYARPTRIARKVAGVPQYVIDYAPLVWLDIGEQYFPSDMYEQITNTHPEINFTSIKNPPALLTLHNLDVLNDYGNDGMNVYLTSNIDVTQGPKWLEGVVPDSTGKTKNAISCAVIINDHGSGDVDVFYMYFYAYNLGNTVFFHELGDHVGDWEHNMIRFKDGEPQAIWFSQHANGQAFTYKVLEKEGLRPITYSAVGSHANYAVAGRHDHAIPDLNLPVGFLLDFTSQGQLWDPTLSTYFYNYQPETASFESINGSPLGAMHFKGRWGDQRYPDSDPRQPPPFFGFRKFVGGPTGPWDKQLNRTNVCPETGIPCIIRDTLGP